MPSRAYMGIHVGVNLSSGLQAYCFMASPQGVQPMQMAGDFGLLAFFLSLISKYNSKNVSARRLGSKYPHQLYPVSFAHHLKQLNLRTRWLNLHGAHFSFASLARRY